jgi:hypothetical protein
MIDYSTFCRLRQLADEKHLTAAQIAAELGLDPKTVAKWMPCPAYQPRQSVKRPSKLDPFKGLILAMLERLSFYETQSSSPKTL